MKKLIKPQDFFLVTLANIFDLFEELHDPFGIMALSCKNMYGFVPNKYKKHNYNHLVWRSLKTEYIEKVIIDGIPHLRLTPKGDNKVKRDFSFLKFQKAKWDRKWRVAIFDIEELSRNTRDNFRNKLKELGFGMFQQSVYISPYDVVEELTEYVKSKGLEDSVRILEVEKISLGDMKPLIYKIWKLNFIEESYRNILLRMEKDDLISIHGRDSGLNKREKLSMEKNRELVSEIYKDYLRIVTKDPFLPLDLLSDNWPGEEVRIKIKELVKDMVLKRK